jgi:nitroreductase
MMNVTINHHKGDRGMYSIETNETLDLFLQRKSVRKYDTSKKIPREVLTQLLKVATTAPSSWNLQHWRFLVIESQENKERLTKIAWNQEQVAESSMVVIVLGDKEAYQNGEKIFSEQVRLNLMPEAIKEHYIQSLPAMYQARPQFAEQDAIRNASLAAMQLMLVARSLGIDSCPMIGFKEDELRESFQIPARYVPVMLITLGYGREEAHPTIRLPLEDVVRYETYDGQS